jgi:hypothetical protein
MQPALALLPLAQNYILRPRASNIGSVLKLDFANNLSTRGANRQALASACSGYTRSGTADAIGGGATATFAANAPIIQASQLQIDGGGTNLLLSSANLAHANWTKTNVDTPVSVSGPGGAATATEVQETTATGLHGVMQQQTVSSGTTFIFHAIVKPTVRSFVQMRVFNGATTIGYVCRYNLSGAGSIVTAYPAVAAGSVTGLKAGISLLESGYYLIWLSGIFGSAQTSIRQYLELMSGVSTQSYAGSTSAKLALAGAWVTTGQTPSNYIPSTDTVNGSRSAATLPITLPTAYYLRRVVDEQGAVSSPVDFTTPGTTVNITPRTDALRVASAEFYTLGAYDTVTRANTSAGSLGTATDGGSYTLLKNPGSFPMVAATNGFVLSNTFAFTPASGANGAVYAVRVMGGSVVTRFMQADVAFDNDTGSTSNTAFALLTSNDQPNLTARMPAHCIIGRTNLRFQYRTVTDGFVTLGVIKPVLGSVPKDGTYRTASFAIQGNKARITWAGISITVQNDILLENSGFACFELFSDQPFGSNTDQAKAQNLLASTAQVGDALVYTAAAPVNVVLPFASGVAVAGNTYTASSTQGGWTSNNGDITFTYQWQFNGVDIGGATGSSLVTATPADIGKTVSVRVIATNATGSTSATSPASAALA